MKKLLLFGFVFLLFINIAYASIDYEQAVYYWKFNNNLNESIENVNTLNGTYQGFVTGKVGNAIDFELDSFQHVGNNTLNGTKVNNTRTFSFWLKPETWAETRHILGIGTLDNQIRAEYSGGKLKVLYYDGTVRWDLYTDGNLPTATWTFIVVVINDTASYLYVNGDLEDMYNRAYDIHYPKKWTHIEFGRWGLVNYGYDGLIDNFYMTEQEWGADEITEAWNSGDGLEYAPVGNQPPAIANLLPENNTETNIREPIFTFIATDDDNLTLNCDLVIDGILSGTNISTLNNTNTTIQSNRTLNISAHEWNVQCTDGEEGNNSDIFILNVINTEPTIPLISPEDNYRIYDTYPIFEFKVIDAEQTELNCDLLIDDIVRGNNISVQNNTNIILQTDTSLSYAVHTWKINCSDGIDMNTSETRNINISPIDLSISLSPPDNSLFNRTNIDFGFIVTGELSIYSCELLLNSVSEYTNSSVFNYTLTEKTITINEGNNYWNITCNGTTSNTFLVKADTIKPTITLGEPIDNTITNYESILLYFNVSDINSYRCSNYINEILNQTIDTSVSGNYNITIWDLTEDWYNWSISCLDLANNTNISNILNFYIDLTNPFISDITPANNSEQDVSSNVSFTIIYKDSSFIYSVRSNLTFCNDTKIFDLDYTDANESLTAVSLNETRALEVNTYCYDTRYCDGHTAKKLSDKFKSPEIVDNEIDFINFKFKPKDKDNIESVYTNKEKDRWEFGWDLKKTKKTEIDLISLYKISYIEKSEYTAHFIIQETEQWIDFEGFEKVKVKKINDYHYVVETTPTKKELKAKSVGELNCVRELYTFDVVSPPECVVDADCAYDERCTNNVCIPIPTAFWSRLGMMFANNIGASFVIFAVILFFIGYGIKLYKD